MGESNNLKVEVFETAADVAAAAADLFASLIKEAIALRGHAFVALSGGSTPEAMYRLLAQPSRAAAIDGSKTVLFLGDERMVPTDDPRSNYGMIQGSAPRMSRFVMPVQTTLGDAALAAADYESTLRVAVKDTRRLDLVLLGLGEDGHTASLFPGMSSLKEQEHWVVASPAGTLPPPVDRVTLTLPVINAARNVVFLVTGKKKTNILQRVMNGEEGLPAAIVHPTDGELYWLIDKAAKGDANS